MLDACRMEPAKHPETIKMCPEQGCRLRLVRRRLLRGLVVRSQDLRNRDPKEVLLLSVCSGKGLIHSHAWLEWQDFHCQVIFLDVELASPGTKADLVLSLPRGAGQSEALCAPAEEALTMYFLFFPLRPLCSRRRGAVRRPPPCIFSIVGTWRPLPFSLFSLECVFMPPWMNQPGTQSVGLSACLPYPAHKYTV